MHLNRPLGAVSASSTVRIEHSLKVGCRSCDGDTAELVRRIVRGGATTVALQCVACGTQVGNPMPLQDHPERSLYPEWTVNPEAPAAPEPSYPPPAPETEVSEYLCRHLRRLHTEGRCEWRAEVRLHVYTHACKGRPDSLRIDYVATFDGGPLIGLEVKRRPDQPAELGRALLQCSQYAMGQVAASGVGTVPQAWIGQPLKAVFLRIDPRNLKETMLQHAKCSVRLYGPANVGYVTFTNWNGMRLDVGGDRWWCERWGYRADAENRTNRGGNGNFKASGE